MLSSIKPRCLRIEATNNTKLRVALLNCTHTCRPIENKEAPLSGQCKIAIRNSHKNFTKNAIQSPPSPQKIKKSLIV